MAVQLVALSVAWKADLWDSQWVEQMVLKLAAERAVERVATMGKS